MRNVVLVDGVRTGFGKLGGSLKDFSTSELAAKAIEGLLEKTKILEKAKVDGVYMGSANPDIRTNALGRYAVLSTKLGYDVWSTTIERQCGSAIEAINHAAGAIMLGYADIMIAGGAESFSQYVCKMSTSNAPYKMAAPTFVAPMHSPVKEDAIDMIFTAENVAKMYGITREECDEFAFRSQMRSKAAWDKGLFDEEIVPVIIPATKKTPEIVFKADEFMKPTTTLEGLAKLKPVKGEGCVVTAGNASGRNDGGGMVLMMTEEKAKELGYEPFARFVSAGNSAVDPKLMGLGPVGASLNALKHAGLGIEDIDIFECNEAFAAQNLGVIKELEKQTGKTINQDNWNPNGGAISYGHPNGASGARVCMFTMRELARRGGRYGLFTSCCGGGLGVTTIIENLRK